jgi:hypothetical protein
MLLEKALAIPSAENDAWNVAEGDVNGKPSLLRFRPNLKSFLGIPTHSQRLVITWEYEQDNSSGMPSENQSEDMRAFEDAIVNALDSDRLAILSFIYTNNGLREWQFYVRDIEEVGIRINTALAGFPKLPISLEVQEDTNWDELHSVYNSCE